ncbi:MAG: glycosyltransferase family 2 protein [Candidatus Sericytochromatia bacterium]
MVRLLNNILPISSCIIAKNEEKNLPLLLESIKSFSKEIIVTDTGSTDKTLEICKEYQVKTYFLPWNNNFSEARNYCIAKATQEWILFFDADFIFLEDSYNNLEKAIANTEIDLYYIKCLEKNGLEHFLPFLFKNNKKLKFYGAIHENIFSEDNRLKTQLSDIKVLHTGFSDEKIIKEKLSRNKFIIENTKIENLSELEKIKLEIYHLYYLINEISNQELEKKIIDLEKKIYSLSKKELKSKKQIIESFYCFCFSKIVKLEIKNNFITRALELFPDSINILYAFYEKLLEEKNYYKAHKILYLILYFIDSNYESLFTYSINPKLKDRAFIFNKIIEMTNFFNKMNLEDLELLFKDTSIYYLKYAKELKKENEFKTSYGVSTPQEEGIGGPAPVPPETPEQRSEVFSNKNKKEAVLYYLEKAILFEEAFYIDELGILVNTFFKNANKKSFEYQEIVQETFNALGGI